MSAVRSDLEERYAFAPAHNLFDVAVAGADRVEGKRVRVFEGKRHDDDGHGKLTGKLSGRQMRLTLEWNAVRQLVKPVAARNAQGTAPTEQTVKYADDPCGRRLAGKAPEAVNELAQFQPFRFLGQYHDSDIGLNCNRFRYDDAAPKNLTPS